MTLRSVGPTVNGMTLAEPQADHVPREISRIATRAASIGLAGVVLCLAVFSIFGAYTMQTQVARAQHEEARHTSYGHLDPSLHDLVGDPDRLTQVVTNLVSNAIKYSPSGGAIELRTEREDSTVTLTVTDHGMGIPKAHLERIFDRYSRVDTTETRVIQGTGLGLPIVRQILQLSDGKVWATSEEGHGSIFHVQLPLLKTATPAPLAA